MTSTEGLKPIVITDFAPGLYNATDWLVPAKGWQTMTDCYPQVGGGLRAFFKADTSALGQSGIVDITKERIIGAGQHGGLIPRAGKAGRTDRYLATMDWDAGVASPRIYRMDQTNDETVWTFVYKTGGVTFLTSGNDNGPGKTSFRPFQLGTNGNLHMLFVNRPNFADAGLWRMAYISQPTVYVEILDASSGHQNGSITLHQARIVMGGGNGTIKWSAPGAETFATSDFLELDPNKDATRISALHGIEPSDLLVMREGAGMVVVQGTLNQNPAVQVTNEGIGTGNTGFFDFCPTPYGLAFISQDGYMYLTDGRTNTRLSEQLAKFTASTDFGTYGDTVFADDFLFGPRGRVYDFRTKSWFLQTQLAGSIKSFNSFDGQIWGPVDDGVNFTLATMVPNTAAARVSNFVAKSAPIHGTDGRLLVIGRVDVACKSYADNSTITITVNGHAYTQLLRTAGTQSVRFVMNERAETLDVQITSTETLAVSEAPSIDSMTVWTKPGHFLPN